MGKNKGGGGGGGGGGPGGGGGNVRDIFDVFFHWQTEIKQKVAL